MKSTIFLNLVFLKGDPAALPEFVDQFALGHWILRLPLGMLLDESRMLHRSCKLRSPSRGLRPRFPIHRG